jgi:hypothetical protein
VPEGHRGCRKACAIGRIQTKLLAPKLGTGQENYMTVFKMSCPQAYKTSTILSRLSRELCNVL